MSAPFMVKAAPGNIALNLTVAAGTTVTYNIYAGATGTNNVALATDTVFESQLQVDMTTGVAVAATWGATVNCYRGGSNSGSGAMPPVWDTQGGPTTQVGGPGTGTANTHYRQSLYLPTAPGWQVVVKNTDATNAITLTITLDTISNVV
jgi:hypothetical protein